MKNSENSEQRCSTCGVTGKMAFEAKDKINTEKKYYACSEQCRMIFDKFAMQQV